MLGPTFDLEASGWLSVLDVCLPPLKLCIEPADAICKMSMMDFYLTTT